MSARLQYFPTPDALVASLSANVLSMLPATRRETLQLLDLYAGDGRLGVSLASALASAGIASDLTFVETSKPRVSLLRKMRAGKVVAANAFRWSGETLFDVTVCNPPFEALGVRQARSRGFAWDQFSRLGRNVYGPGLVRALELTARQGLVGAILPFSWIHRVSTSGLRDEVTRLCSRVQVHAISTRQAFPGTTQDVAVHVFVRRDDTTEEPTRLEVFVDGSPKTDGSLPSRTRSSLARGATRSIRVGSVVWNREGERLRRYGRSAVPLIYGGNIVDGVVSMPNSKYNGRQAVSRRDLRATELRRAPFLAVRRILRGRPGAWCADVCLIDHFDAVAENHVITVELAEASGAASWPIALARAIEDVHKFSGNPTLSVGEVIAAAEAVGVRLR